MGEAIKHIWPVYVHTQHISRLSFDNVSTAIAAILSDSLLLDSNVIDREFNVTQNIVQYTYVSNNIKFVVNLTSALQTMYQALIAQLTLLASPMSVVEGPSRTSTFRLEAKYVLIYTRRDTSNLMYLGIHTVHLWPTL